MAFTDLLVPGGHRAEDLVGDQAFLDALVRVESAWAMAQADAGLLDPALAHRVVALLEEDPRGLLAEVAEQAEGGGNPVIPWVRAARARCAEAETGGSDLPAAVHRGLTSQDVMDTVLMERTAAALERVHEQLGRAGRALAARVLEHAETPMAARTLGQHALPTTFGARAGRWLDALAAALQATRRTTLFLPVSGGGAAGTRAALLELEDPAPDAALGLSLPDRLGVFWARRLGLNAPAPAQVWHTRRRPLVAALEPLEQAAAACAKLAGDLGISARAEIGELAEPAAPGRGGSSAMPHKRNPTLSLLIRRSGVRAARSLGEVLESEALAVEERSDLAWHLEWEPVRSVLRHAVVGTSLAAELLEGLEVFPEAMRAALELDGPQAPGRTAEGWQTGDSAEQARAAVRRWERAEEADEEENA